MGAPAYPDIRAVIVDKYFARSAYLAALCCGITRWHQVSRAHKLRGAAIERTGDWVFELRGKGPNLIGRLTLCGVGIKAHNTDLGALNLGLHRAHRRGIAQFRYQAL